VIPIFEIQFDDNILMRIRGRTYRRIVPNHRRRHRVVSGGIGLLRLRLGNHLPVHQEDRRAASSQAELAHARRKGALVSGAQNERSGAIESQGILGIPGGDAHETEGVLCVPLCRLLRRQFELVTGRNLFEQLYIHRARIE